MAHTSLYLATSDFLARQELFQEILLRETRVIIALKDHTKTLIISLSIISSIEKPNETIVNHNITI